MTITQLKNIILEAFVNVKLGDGITLQSADAFDNYGHGGGGAAILSLSPTAYTDKWRDIPLEVLEVYGQVAHLNAEGYRYYIPAYMISVLDDYEPGSMRVIGTLSSMYTHENRTDTYNERQLSLLNAKQKEAIAIYLSELPNLIPLDIRDTRNVPRALEHYWKQFLPQSATKAK